MKRREPAKYLDYAAAARLLGLSELTLRTYRTRRTPPPPIVKVGQKGLFDRAELLAWWEDQQRRPVVQKRDQRLGPIGEAAG